MKYAGIVAVLLVLTALFSAAKIRDVGQFRGDTAIFFQTTENIAHGLGARSQVFANTQAVQESGLALMTASQIAKDPLAPPTVNERNLLRFHAYYVLYPLALLTYVVPVNVLLLGLYVLSFLGLLALAYLALRREGVAWGAALLFCLLVASHPAWSQGLLDGQFFPDLFFLAAGFAYALAIAQPKARRGPLLGAALACAILGERAALYAGVFTLLYLLFFRRSEIADRRFKAATGIALTLAGAIMLKFGINNSEYATFLPVTLAQAIGMWTTPGFAPDALVFVAANLPLLALACFEYRAGAIAAILMLPNLLGDIGGAEKVGWSTHYHAYYFPILVWAASQGFLALYRRRLRWNRVDAVYPALLVLLLFESALDPANNVLFAAPRKVVTYLGARGSLQIAAANALAQAVPAGATVATTETGMPFLYRGRTIRFFPVDIDHADYAVVQAGQNPDGTFSYSGTITFLGPSAQSKIDAVINARMKRDGYDLAHPVFLAPLGVAVLKRIE